MVDQVAPIAATASRSFTVQSHISTWKPRSLILRTRSRYGRSRNSISVVTANGNIGVLMQASFRTGCAVADRMNRRQPGTGSPTAAAD